VTASNVASAKGRRRASAAHQRTLSPPGLTRPTRIMPREKSAATTLPLGSRASARARCPGAARHIEQPAARGKRGFLHDGLRQARSLPKS